MASEIQQTAPAPQWARWARYGAGLLLGVLGVLLNRIDLELLTEETPLFVLGGAPVLLAFVLAGLGPGLLAAAIALTPTLGVALEVEPGLAAVPVLYTLEALAAYFVYRRFPSLVLGVLGFWLVAGWWLDLLVYHQLVGLSLDYTLLVYLKQVLNGLLNAVVAESVLILPWERWTHWRSPERPVQGLATHLFRRAVLGVMVVALPVAFVTTRAVFERDVELALARQAQVGREIAALGQRFVVAARDHVQRIAAELSGEHATGEPVGEERLAEALGSRPELLALRLLDRDGRPAAVVRKGRASTALEETRSAEPAGPGEGPVELAIGFARREDGSRGGALQVSAGLTGPLAAWRLEGLVSLRSLGPALFQQRLHPEEAITFVGEGGLLSSERPELRESLGEDLERRLATGMERFSYYPPPDDSLESRLGIDLHHAAVVRFGPPPVAILVDLAAVDLHTQVRPSVLWVLSFLLGTLGVLYAALALIARRVAKPLHRLEEASLEIARGRFPPLEDLEDLESHSVAEVRQLAANFSEMREALAHRDPLTGLPNREHFVELLRTRLQGGPSFAVVYLDLDDFQDVEGTLGRDGADRILRRVGRRLEGMLYPEDVCARLEGDEFALLVDGIRDVEQVGAVARRLRAELAVPFELGGWELYLTASLGVSLCPLDAETPEELLRHARAAMQKAKEGGRDRWRLYSQEMHRQAEERVELQADLRRALDGGGLEVHYQPIVDLESGRISTLEALARWSHPVRGQVPPAVFIPLAEGSGLITQVDEFVAGRALRDMISWGNGNGPGLSLNVSARHLGGGERSLDERMGEALADAGIGSGRLQLEITESFAIRDLRSGGEILERLRELGVGLCIDDFGAGHASFAYLRQLPVDAIKLDRAYVADLDHNPVAVAIARAIVALGDELGIQVVAEGVETGEQLDLARRLGFDAVQGFFVARPGPASEIAKILERDDLVPDG